MGSCKNAGNLINFDGASEVGSERRPSWNSPGVKKYIGEKGVKESQDPQDRFMKSADLRRRETGIFIMRQIFYKN